MTKVIDQGGFSLLKIFGLFSFAKLKFSQGDFREKSLLVFQRLTPLFIALFFVGSGLVYGQLRAAHLVGLVLIPGVFYLLHDRSRDWKSIREIFWVSFFLFWQILSLLWVKDIQLGINYVFYIANQVFAVTALWLYCKGQEEVQRVLKFLFWVYLADICIGLLETFAHPFRWFVARQSTLNSYFGIDPIYQYYVDNLMMRKDSYPIQYEYLINQPSGFHWGPNQFGLMLAVTLPFAFVFVRSRWLQLMFASASVYMSFIVTSRSVMVGLALGAAVVLLGRNTPKFTRALALLTILVLGSTPILPLQEMGMNPERISKLQEFKIAVKSYSTIQAAENVFKETKAKQVEAFDRQLQQSGIKDGSISKRKLMILLAWNEFKKTLGWGLGAGNSAQYSGMIFGKSQIHNFWLEVVFEVGVIVAVLLLLGGGYLLWRLVKQSRNIGAGIQCSLALASLGALLASVPAALAVGTMAYQTPFWIALGLALISFKSLSRETSGS